MLLLCWIYSSFSYELVSLQDQPLNHSLEAFGRRKNKKFWMYRTLEKPPCMCKAFNFWHKELMSSLCCASTLSFKLPLGFLQLPSYLAISNVENTFLTKDSGMLSEFGIAWPLSLGFLITALSLHITVFKEIVKNVILNSMLRNFDQVFKWHM